MFLLFGLLYTIESFSEARAGPAISLTDGFAAVADKAGAGPDGVAALAAHANLDGLPGEGGLGHAVRRTSGR